MKLRKYFRKSKDEAGFTLIELMVVVVILGVLAAMVLPRIVGDVTSDAREAANAANLKMLQSAVDRYTADVGSVPSNLTALTGTAGNGPYIDQVPTAPTGFRAYTLSGQTVTNSSSSSTESSTETT